MLSQVIEKGTRILDLAPQEHVSTLICQGFEISGMLCLVKVKSIDGFRDRLKPELDLYK